MVRLFFTHSFVFLLVLVNLPSLSNSRAFAAGDTPTGEVSFPETVEINENVESFFNGLASTLFNDFSITEVNLERDAQGALVNALNRGRLAGNFNGVLQKNGQESVFNSDFSVVIGIEPERNLEYEIHVRAQGDITQPQVFLQNYLEKSVVQCGQFRRDDGLFSRDELCQRLTSSHDWAQQSAPQQAAMIATALKSGLISQIQNMKGREISIIRDDLIRYLDQQIEIDTSNPALTRIDIDLSQLSELFSQQARGFLNEHELRDYHYKSISMVISEEAMEFDYFMVKLHVQTRFKLYMGALGQLQETLERRNKGESVGTDLRRGSGLKKALTSNSTWGNYISAGKLLFIDGVDDEAAPVSEEAANELDELGLD